MLDIVLGSIGAAARRARGVIFLVWKHWHGKN
jgi:hypothetical protein